MVRRSYGRVAATPGGPETTAAPERTGEIQMRAPAPGRHPGDMKVEVAVVDPADEPTVEAIQAVRVAADAVDVPDLPPYCPYVFRGEMTHQGTTKRRE